FGTNGQVFTEIMPLGVGRYGDSLSGLAVLSDGKIVAAGESDLNFAVARYSADGVLDPSFDNAGKTTVAFGVVQVKRVLVQRHERRRSSGCEGRSWFRERPAQWLWSRLSHWRGVKHRCDRRSGQRRDQQLRQEHSLSNHRRRRKRQDHRRQQK